VVIKKWAGPNAPPQPGEPTTKATANIKSRLFFITISLESDDGYLKSRSNSVNVSRDEKDGSIEIGFLFRSTISKPKPTDSASHNGAASLQIKRGNSGEIEMEGNYWTDRNWQTGLNTAGKITLRRPGVAVAA
jgi:hypothetical protein